MLPFGKWRQIERERDELAARVQTLERQHATDLQLLDGLGEALLGVDEKRRVVMANRRFIDLFGGMDHVGKLLSEVLRVSEVFRAFDVALGGEDATVRFSVRSGVAERRIEMRAQPLASGAIAAVALFIDVTKIERLEQIRRDFISDFSHEVRTPLAGLRSALETLETNGHRISHDEEQQLRRIMARQLRRLERLVDDLSELSRIEAGDVTLDIRTVDLRRVIDDLVEDFAEQAAQHRVRFDVQGEGSAIADATRMQQAFSNLIDNAIKYGGDGHTITIAVRDGDVRVIDEGQGIPASEHEKIFHRFYRIDKSAPGSGLGLAITKHLVLQQRGTVDVESQPGKGATFIVRLPRAAATPQARS
ncbi:MAG TPA: ATP-binding protein [Thermoanaerobaculia bacterium]|nr:ATP-binding protein [Thermoanaerobaculia bacterium]